MNGDPDSSVEDGDYAIPVRTNEFRARGDRPRERIMVSVTEEDCRSIVEQWFGSSKAKLLNYEVVSDNKSSLGLLGAKQNLCLTVQFHGQINFLRLFIKTPPLHNDFLTDYVRRTGCCRKEHAFYAAIAPKLRPFTLGSEFPKCFLSREDEITVLEDLSEAGYETRRVRDYMSLEDLEAALEALAGLHAASLAWEERSGTSIGQLYPDLMGEEYYGKTPDHPGYRHLAASVAAVEAVIERHLPQFPERAVQYALEIFRRLPDELGPSLKWRNVVSHADLWCNNIMFLRHSKVACLVDFQLMRYTPPILDVLILLRLNGHPEARRTQTGHLLRYYHAALRSKLNAQNLELDRILRWDTFLDSKKDYEEISMAIAALFLHLVLLEDGFVRDTFGSPQGLENFMNHSRKDIVLRAADSDSLYRQRVVGTLSELLDYITAKLEPVVT